MPQTAEAVYAICDFKDGDFFEMAQLPGHPIYVRGNINGLGNAQESDTVIHKTADLGSACDSLTEEFNPLYETDQYGNANPF